MDASKGPVIIMSQLKSIYNSPFKDSHSHPIHTCFPIIANNVLDKVMSHNQSHTGVHQCHLMFKRSNAIELQCISFHTYLCNGDVSVCIMTPNLSPCLVMYMNSPPLSHFIKPKQ